MARFRLNTPAKIREIIRVICDSGAMTIWVTTDETLLVNGVPVTAPALAEARQQIAHEGVFNPRWDELTAQEQRDSSLAAASYLLSLRRIAPPPGREAASVYVRPPFQLYEIGAEPHPRNSPPEPGVALIERELDGGPTIQSHLIEPDQARTLACRLWAAADQAESGPRA